jgi:hypothetical protein
VKQPPPGSTAKREVTIELVGGERVVDRGTSEVTWWVRRGRSWVNAGEWPGARLEQLEAGPGTIWQTRIELALVAGSVLLKVESRPGVRVRRDAMDWLKSDARGAARALRKSYFRVGRSGELERLERSPRS